MTADPTDGAIRAVLAQVRAHLGMQVGQDPVPVHTLSPVSLDAVRRLIPRIEDLLDLTDSGAEMAGKREAAEIRGALARGVPTRYASIVTTPEGDRLLVEGWAVAPVVTVRQEGGWRPPEHLDGWNAEVAP